MHKKILPHLKDLDSSSIDIEASLLVSTDGLVIAATLPITMDADELGAICAGTFLLGRRTSKKCASGLLNQVLIQCAHNGIMMIYAGKETILAVITKPSANTEQVIGELKRFIEKINKFI